MSNARSPRDVCSTTIGTRGLIVLALFRFVGSIPAGGEPSASAPIRCRPSLATGPSRPGGFGSFARGCSARADAASGARRPELLARLRLPDGDRLRLLGEQVERLARG